MNWRREFLSFSNYAVSGYRICRRSSLAPYLSSLIPAVPHFSCPLPLVPCHLSLPPGTPGTVPVVPFTLATNHRVLSTFQATDPMVTGPSGTRRCLRVQSPLDQAPGTDAHRSRSPCFLLSLAPCPLSLIPATRDTRNCPRCPFHFSHQPPSAEC